MHTNPYVAVTETPAENAVPVAPLPRIKKAKSLLQDTAGVDSTNRSTGNGNRKVSAVDTLPVALVPLSTADCPVTDVMPNSGPMWTLSVHSQDSENEQQQQQQQQQQQRIYPLSAFEDVYRLRRQLGRGSYSVVFEVVDRATNERKAAKFVIWREGKHTSRREKECREGLLDDNETDGDDRVGAAECGSMSTAPPALSETLVKEIAISFAVQHPNLVSSSDVFVHDVEGLQCRLEQYAPQVTLLSPPGTSRRKKKEVTRVAAPKSWRHGARPAVSMSSVVVDSAAESNQAAVDSVRRQLQEGVVQCVLVMELLSGRDLFSLVSHHPLKESRAAGYMRDLLLALQHLHDRHIVHRDVKVENMVLDRKNRARLVDYGFCEELSCLGATTTSCTSSTQEKKDKLLTQFCGSHHYVAPEVIRAAIHLHPRTKPSGWREAVEDVRLPPISPVSVAPQLQDLTVTASGAPQEERQENGRICVAGSVRNLRTLLAGRRVGYGTSADLWSAGVVMFVLLHSAFPYHDERRSKLLRLILTGHQQTQPLPSLSKEAKDLLQQLLTHDVRLRPTAAQALEHPWFKKQLG